MTTAILHRFFGRGRARTEQALEVIRELREQTNEVIERNTQRIAEVDGEAGWWIRTADDPQHRDRRPRCGCEPTE